MVERYDEQQARRMRIALVADDVYCIVSEALKKLYPTKTPLNNVEIWMAAHGLTCDLMQSAAPEEILDDLVEELREEIPHQVRDEASPTPHSGLDPESQTTLFLILMVSMCQISGLRKQIKNAETIARRLMDVCRQHEMYYSLLEQFDGKEIRLRMAGHKIDLLTYEMKVAGENKEENRQMLDGFVQAVLKLGPQNIESNLLVLNKLNLQNGHIYDDVILGMYEQLEQKSAPQKAIEMILGNKNVATDGGLQMNGDMKGDASTFLAMLNGLKQLGDGSR